MDVNSAAAIATAQSQSQISQAVAIKVLKMANQQQQSVLALLDAAVESIDAAQINAGHVDVRA